MRHLKLHFRFGVFFVYLFLLSMSFVCISGLLRVRLYTVMAVVVIVVGV